MTSEPAPAFLPHLQELARQHARDHPYTIALRLQAMHGITIDGRRAKSLLIAHHNTTHD